MVRTGGGASVSVWKSAPPVPLGATTEGSASPSHSHSDDVDRTDEAGATLRTRSSRKKHISAGVWPCKINGCNKSFAREADLKRHQRTTKLHSMPSFACPQCDANFTRTDALRRHQKSRHNGIIIEPAEDSNDGDENADAQSRSRTPSPKGKEKATNIPVQTHQGTPTQTGPSSYYRSHTATISPYVPPRLQQLPQPNQITHPTSSIRNGPPWPTYIPSWHTNNDGNSNNVPPNMGPISYIPHPVYHPSPHYRPHTTGYSPSPPNVNTIANGSTSSQPSAVPSRNSSAQPQVHPPSASAASGGGIDINASIGPSELEPPGKEITAEEVVAAVEAALRHAAASQSHGDVDRDEHDELERKSQSELLELEEESRRSMEREMEDRMIGMHGYASSLERPEPMEHMLTEDGEPMLNPAELLTQESLASPPPS